VVTIDPLPPIDAQPTPLLFLSGRGDLTTDYRPHLPADQPEGEWHLALAPRRAQEDYAYLVLIVDRRTLGVRGIETVEEDGSRTTIRFSRVRENVGLEPAEFTFTPPRGVEVIRR
jgi:NAD+ synthase (glutamine-hydrolysing)/outer membrane lipoprotein carrier protein